MIVGTLQIYLYLGLFLGWLAIITSADELRLQLEAEHPQRSTLNKLYGLLFMWGVLALLWPFLAHDVYRGKA